MVEYWLAAGTGGVDLSDKLPLGVGADAGARGSPWGERGATGGRRAVMCRTLALAWHSTLVCGTRCSPRHQCE